MHTTLDNPVKPRQNIVYADILPQPAAERDSAEVVPALDRPMEGRCPLILTEIFVPSQVIFVTCSISAPSFLRPQCSKSQTVISPPAPARLFPLAITLYYSQSLPGAPTTAAGVLLADNGKLSVYRQ
jgi:hypothetical protein